MTLVLVGSLVGCAGSSPTKKEEATTPAET